jgi:2',3'-cyclic-nucleotide 2'-phosphodiesterase (5'-nucleotidase family)
MAGAIAGAAGAALSSPLVLARPKASGAKRLTLLHLTDTHAQLETHAEFMPGERPEIQQMGGYARLKTAIDRERAAADGPSFLLDGGDEFQGSGAAAWSQGGVMLEPLNALGIDAFVPGNWEPVYGPERMMELMRKLDTAVIAYNFHDSDTGERLFKPAITIERDGVRVAFVGLTDVTTTVRQPPAQVKGLDSTRIDGLREFVKELRTKERPDLVVGVAHMGLTVTRQMAREIPEFDVILSGHTHERTEKAILEGHVIVVEAGSMGSFLGRLDLTLKPGGGGGVAGHDFRLIPVTADAYPEDARMKRVVDEALRPHRARLNEVACRTETPILRYDVLETSADNLIAEVVRAAAGADVGFTNGFRFGLPIPAGPVTVGDLWSLLPLDARMKVGKVTGRQLREYLENELELVYSGDPWRLSGGWGPRASGMTMTYAAKARPGHRLISVKVNGREVGDADEYTMAGCEREGEPLDVICRLRGTREARMLPESVHAALARYFKTHPVVAPRRDGRAVAVDLPREILSLDETLSARS